MRHVLQVAISATYAMCAAVNAAGVESMQSTVQQVPGLEEYVQNVVAETGAPGVMVAVVREGEPVLIRGFGVREIGVDGAIDEHTIFPVASLSKAITVNALGLLVEEGKLGWDDPVQKHLPEFELHDPWISCQTTIKDLLAHRTGINKGDLLWQRRDLPIDQIIARLRYVDGKEFRDAFRYNNLMYLVAGEVLVRTSGMPWSQFVQERIFVPAGMTRSGNAYAWLLEQENVVRPHTRIDGQVIAAPFTNGDLVGPAGGCHSSGSDLARWMLIQLEGGKIGGQQVVPVAVIEASRQPCILRQIKPEEREDSPSTHFHAYGMGWNLRDYAGRLLVSHSGANRGIRAHMLLMPELRLGVTVIVNYDRLDLAEPLSRWVLDRCLGRPSQDWVAISFARAKMAEQKAEAQRQKQEAERPREALSAHPLEEYTGRYESPAYGPAEVMRAEEGLLVSLGSEFVLTLEPWQGDTFRGSWRDPAYQNQLEAAMLKFTFDPEGGVEAVEIGQWGSFQKQP